MIKWKWRNKERRKVQLRKEGRISCSNPEYRVWRVEREASTYENGKFMFSLSLSFSPSILPSHSETRSLDIWDICIIINVLFAFIPSSLFFFNNLINTSTNPTHFPFNSIQFHSIPFNSFVFLFLFLILKFVNLFWFHLQFFLSQNPISSFVVQYVVYLVISY